jgi:hypothetical protein
VVVQTLPRLSTQAGARSPCRQSRGRATACISPKGGARKLAQFVEREIDRWLNSRLVAVEFPVEEQKAPEPAAMEVVSGKADLPRRDRSQARSLTRFASPSLFLYLGDAQPRETEVINRILPSQELLGRQNIAAAGFFER